MLFNLTLGCLAGLLLFGCTDPAQLRPIALLISTDVANGLIDTHGAQGSLPVNYDESAKWFHDKDVTPQDCDDGFTLAMALNLEAENRVDIRGIVPIFGNASLPAEMLVADQIVRNLKNRPDLPMQPGAIGPAGQILQPAPITYDLGTLSVVESFGASCNNPGVDLMLTELLASPEPITVLAIGPLTDVACLLQNHPDVAREKIAEIVILASRVNKDSLLINNKVVNDFNFRMDPVGGTLLFASAGDIPIKLITFSLSGQTSQTGARHISFDASTLKGPQPPTPASQKSLEWLLESSQQRNAYWSGIFDANEGPFDQYTLAVVLWPDLFKCGPALAYVQQCPYPAWSPNYPGSNPYNAPNNPCADHGEKNAANLSGIAAQLIVTDLENPGPLVRGVEGIDGNLPQLEGVPAVQVEACTDFASDEAFEQFKQLLYKYTW